MGFGHEQHPSHQVGGGDALRAFTLAVPTLVLHLGVSVLPIHRECDVI